MKVGDLFSGIGGFGLAAKQMGWDNVFMVEKDERCQSLLKKRFPTTTIYADIKNFDAAKYKGSIDILTGGFPCQPFSNAGKQRGESDDRYLFPEMLRVISECSPTIVLGENVYGIAKTALQGIKTQLEDLGYFVIPFNIPASAIGALHRRSRIWIVAFKKDAFDSNTNSIRSYRTKINQQGSFEFQYKQIGQSGSVVSESIRNGTNPRIFGNVNGLSNRVDRLRGVGNAVDPRVVIEIFKSLSWALSFGGIQ